MKEVLIGNTTECLKHLLGIIKNEKDYYERRRQMAIFLGIKENSIQRWSLQEYLPVGEILIKLRYYLEHNGYGVSELVELDPDIRNAGQVYAFGIVTISELSSWVGYSGEERHSYMLAVLRGVNGISEERRKPYQEFFELYKDELETRQKQLGRIIQLKKVFGESEGTPQNEASRYDQSVVTKIAAPVKAKCESPVHTDVIIQSFAHLVRSMLPLADALISADFSAEDRNRMRELAGGNGVFRLSNLLNGLCGETARRERNKK